MTPENEGGQQLLLTLNNLLRTVIIHDDVNQHSIGCAVNFVDAVSSRLYTEGEDFTLQTDNGRFYVGDEKIPFTVSTATLIQVMLDYFGKRQLAGFTFFSAINKVSPPDVLTFARLVNLAAGKEEPLAWLKKSIEEKGFAWVELFEAPEESANLESEWKREEEAADEETRRELVRKTYSYGLANLKELATKLGAGRRAGINKSVRVVQSMVNLLRDDEPALLGLSTLRIYDDYTYGHSVNVALLAMCIGKRIGLSRQALEKLGLCGLLHDLGKISIPLDILKKPDKFTERELRIMQSHSLHSVRQIVMLRAQHSRKAQLVLPAFEHHMKFDLSGYPRTSNWYISLFGRIITIADVFDAITSPRVYRKTAKSPDRALLYMMEKSGEFFDPILLKIFVRMLGIYPLGTLVEFDSGEIGLVVDTLAENNDSGIPLPRVLLLLPDGNSGYIKGETINLAVQFLDTGAKQRKITNTVHPAEYNIQPAQYLF